MINKARNKTTGEIVEYMTFFPEDIQEIERFIKKKISKTNLDDTWKCPFTDVASYIIHKFDIVVMNPSDKDPLHFYEPHDFLQSFVRIENEFKHEFFPEPTMSDFCYEARPARIKGPADVKPRLVYDKAVIEHYVAEYEKEIAKLKARIAELEESGEAQRSNNG